MASRNFKEERLIGMAVGETMATKERGNSMVPLIRSNQEHVLAKVEDWKSVSVGDIVYCKVAGRWYTHLVTAKDDQRGLQISNNHGYVNGWTRHVLAKVIEVIQ